MNPRSLIEAAQQVLDALDTLKIAWRVGMPEYGAEDQDELLETAIAAQLSMLSILQEPVYSIEHLDQAYELGFSEGVKAAPQLKAEQQWCACEPTECKGVGRCRWQAMSYSPFDKQPAEQEPVAWRMIDRDDASQGWWFDETPGGAGYFCQPLYTTPQPKAEPWTPRELELIDGMIEVQLNHAERCDRIANRTMAEKQKGWDMERVALLRKIRGTAPQPAKREPLTEREIELIDGMIEVQLDHAERCDAIANRRMAEKQKQWDMERVALLQKIRAHGIGEKE